MLIKSSQCTIVCVSISVTAYVICFYLGVLHISQLGSVSNSPQQLEANGPPVLVCDRLLVNISQPCLCYVNFNGNSIDNVIVSRKDKRIVSDVNHIKCAMTFVEGGRLGNVMTQYATLYSLANMNKRPAFMSPGMAKFLKPYFKVSIPVMNSAMYSKINWTKRVVNDWMQDSYRRMEGQFIRVRNYVPNSYTFYDHLRDKIRKEFQPKDEIMQMAQNFLLNLRGNRTSVTFVGVHVRRGDYVKIMANGLKGVVGDRNFFIKATKYYRDNYPDAIFVVASNDMKWCEENIPNDKGDVYLAGNGNETHPSRDFAILVSCNHTIFTIGTFGHWVAYVTGGEVVYLANFTAPDSIYRQFFKTGNTFPPHWIPIQADLSPVYNVTQTPVRKP